MKKKLIQRLPAILLLAGSFLFWSNYDRYEPAGPILLKSPGLADATRVRGDCAETNGLFTLKVPAAGKIAGINFRLPEASDYQIIRVRGRIKVEEVIEGKYSWSCARLLLTQYDEKNKWISGHHGLVAERGTKDWAEHDDEFEIMPEAAHADVVIQQRGTAGTAWFTDIEAQPVRLRAWFPVWRILFTILWLAAGVLYFRRCRLHKRRLKLLILLNALAIITGALMPGEWLEDGATMAKEYMVRLNPPAPVEKPKTVVQKPATAQKQAAAKPAKASAPSKESARMDSFNLAVGSVHKIGHFALFASLCFLIYLSAELERQHPVYFAKVGFDMLIFAAITEQAQNLTMDRAAGWRDMLTDVYGMIFALLIFACLRPLLRKMLR